MTEVQVTRKGQITIPVALRRRFKIEEGCRVEVSEGEGVITVRRLPCLMDLAGSAAGEAKLEELYEELDRMREQDA